MTHNSGTGNDVGSGGEGNDTISGYAATTLWLRCRHDTHWRQWR